MKKFVALVALLLAVMMTVTSAMACSAMYIGSALTANGDTYFGRSEDFANSRNKVMYVSPAGNHKAGEVYDGCYGFTYTFTHDSYSYTAFRDDNLGENVCPNCGSTHAHTPYEAGGTNEKGVSVSATETLYCEDAVLDCDPYEDAGIEEAEITTVILSEAATAREGVELITKIYDEAGCCDGAGIFVADNTEVWYIENLTGHQYVALKLSDTLVFTQPNVCMIGLIDLDDTENVIASAGLIEVAKNGGFFVGDEEKNIIDYKGSYNGGASAGTRVKDALHYFNPAYDFSETEPDVALFTITNLDAEGNIAAMHTGIELDRAFTTEDVLGYWNKVHSIGKPGNLETHVFQLSAQDGVTDTIEWVAMDDAFVNVFVPYYPMLTTDVADSLKVGTETAAFVEEQPAEGVYYASSKRARVDGEIVTLQGFTVLPANWADSFYWTIDAISNLVEYGELTDEQKADVFAALAAKQAELIAAFETTKANVAAAATMEDAVAIATADSMAFANGVHDLAVELVNAILAK